MTETTPTLSLPVMMPAQAQKYVTHNEALEILDMAVHCALVRIDLATPPAVPAEGDAYAVPPGAEGAWAGQEGRIASWRGGGWMFHAPHPGWIAWVAEAGELHVWTGSGWEMRGAEAPRENLDGLGVGAGYDAVNRLTVAADGSLFSHAGNGHRVTVNKAAATDTASLLFQSGWSGRAEIGLAGEDALSVKVSADGAAWAEALRVDGATGQVTLSQVLRLTPGAEPAGAVAGQVYFDAVTGKLRCHDGTLWHDLY